MSNGAIDLIREELAKKSIPLNELIAFKNEIEDAIKIMQDEMIKQFRETALANGIELQFLVDELVKPSIEIEVEVTPNKRPAKYRNKDNENETWCGIGKKPKWIEKWIDDGNDVNELLIEKSNQ
jgi:DNA-binding protein H-NS